jgi:hypothetical protein
VYARKAVEQAELLRQQKREEQQRLKQDKKFSWNQKVGTGRAAQPRLKCMPL